MSSEPERVGCGHVAYAAYKFVRLCMAIAYRLAMMILFVLAIVKAGTSEELAARAAMITDDEGLLAALVGLVIIVAWYVLIVKPGSWIYGTKRDILNPNDRREE